MTTENTAVLATWLNEPKEPPFVPPKAPYPWRRYFARSFDFGLITTCYEVLVCLLLRVNFSERNLFLELIDIYICWGLIFLLEPLFLSRWGKTPGKWLFGLSIRNKNGELLTRKEAFDRTFAVFCKGEGFAIPFYDLYRYYQSYKICRDDGVMEWDENFRYEAKPFHPASVFGYLGITAVALTLSTGISFWRMNPPNKGMLTVGEFIENYNYQLDYNKIEGVMRLEEDRTWLTEEEQYEDAVAHIHTFDLSDSVISEPVFKESNGNLSSFSFTEENTTGGILYSPNEKTWLAGALLRTQIGMFYPEMNKLEGQLIKTADPREQSSDSVPVISYIEEHPFCSYTMEIGNIRIIQEVTLIGYEASNKHYGKYLFSDDDAEETYYSMTFTLEQLPE